MKQKKIIGIVAAIIVLALLIKYSGIIFGGISLFIQVVRPLFMGCIIAYILNILVSGLERLPVFRPAHKRLYKVRRPLCILGALVIIIAIIVLLIIIVIPQLIDAIGVLAKEIPNSIAALNAWFTSSDTDWPGIKKFLESLDVDWPQLLQKAGAHLSSGLSNLFSSTVYILSSIGSLIVTFVIALIFSIYILAGKEQLFRQFRTLAQTYLKETCCRRTALVLSTAHDTFTRFIIGQCTEAVILGALCTAGMFILRFPYAAMIGTLIGATALLPVVGAYIGAFVGAFMIFTVNPMQAAGFLVFIVILQQIEGNLIYPRVVGSSVGLPGIWVLAAVTIGGGLSGIIGMLFAVPVTATIYKLIRRDVRRRKKAGETSPA